MRRTAAFLESYMKRFIERTNAVTRAAAILAIVIACARVAPAQTPPPPPPPGSADLASAEQMIDDAIKKIEDNDLDHAAELIRKARVLNPNMNKIKLAEGLFGVALKRDQGPAAINSLEAYNKSPEGQSDYRGFLAVGRQYASSFLFQQAIPALEKAKKLAPAEQDGHHVRAEVAIELANMYLLKKQNARALDEAKDAQNLAPDDMRVQLSLAQIAFRTEEFETAAKCCDHAIELLHTALRNDPLKRETYQLLLNAYSLRTPMLQREIKAKPDAAAPYYRLAINARNLAEVVRLANLLDARENATQALNKEPNNAECLLLAAQLEAELGAVDEARRHVDELLKIKPDYREALELRERLQPGTGGFKVP
jgi:tetratricopeptide (TPR) repeat protein